MTVLGLILGSLATPLYVRWLMGPGAGRFMGAVFMQIVVIVFLPMLAGHYTQKWLVARHGQAEYQKEWGRASRRSPPWACSASFSSRSPQGEGPRRPARRADRGAGAAVVPVRDQLRGEHGGRAQPAAARRRHRAGATAR